MDIVDFGYPYNDIEYNDLVLCLGYFDGVHRGHASLIERAKKEGYKVGVLTFDISPAFVTGKVERRSFITSNSDKAEILESLGVDTLFLMQFGKEESQLTKDEFIDNVLKKINPKKIVCGSDFRFGARGEGTPKYLSYYFDVISLELLCQKENVKIAARDIISYIKSGEVDKANELLGRNYRISGTVVQGLQNGRKIDYPTANLQMDNDYVYPAMGVYAGYADVYGQRYKAMINIGRHPTVSMLDDPIIEVHIIDFSGLLYGKDIFVEFVSKIREEKYFVSLDELKEQLEKDLEFVKSSLQ